MAKVEERGRLFEGRHFDREVIILCVRWYLRFNRCLRDLVEMMAERSLSTAHTTIMRWVQYVTAQEFEKRWQRYARSSAAHGASMRRPSGGSAAMVLAFYRALDRAGRTVDSWLSARRDVAAASGMSFAKRLEASSVPQTITLDGCAASQ